MARDTVYLRSKRNGGFLTGARHATLGTEDQMSRMKKMLAQKAQQNAAASDPGAGDDPDAAQDPSERNDEMPVKDEEDDEVIGGGEQAAPNYRPASGMSDCAGCMHYDKGDSECERYEFTAKPDYVCDAYKPQGDEENEDFSTGDTVSPTATDDGQVGPSSY